MNQIIKYFYRFIGVFFVLTAFGKATDSSGVERVFAFLKFSADAASIIVWLLIIFELVVGLAMIFQLFPFFTASLSCLALILFSIFLTILLFLPEAPHCGCTGGFKLFKTAFSENLFGLIRNLCFLTITGSYWLDTFKKFSLTSIKSHPKNETL